MITMMTTMITKTTMITMTISMKVTYSTPCAAPAGVNCVDYNECPAIEPGIIVIIVIVSAALEIFLSPSHHTSKMSRCHNVPFDPPHIKVGCPGCPVTGGSVLSPENQVFLSRLHRHDYIIVIVITIMIT